MPEDRNTQRFVMSTWLRPEHEPLVDQAVIHYKVANRSQLLQKLLIDAINKMTKKEAAHG